MGGKSGGTTVIQPSAPPQPSTAEAINAWVNAMPQVYETQAKYAPLEAQTQLSLLQQYGAPMGQATLAAMNAMYPQTTALQENLAGQATEGMKSTPPQWAQDQYRSGLAANLGTNAGSPIGADYMSRGMLQQQQDWQNYYRDLALSTSGRQPLAQAGNPAYSNYMSNFTPTANMNYMANTYSTYAAATRPLLGQAGQSNTMGNIGGIMGGLGGLAMGAGMMGL
jgi:hypothetical protein